MKYKVFPNGQIAEFVPEKATEGETWVIRRWLTNKERFKFPSHPNVVRCNEGRIGEGRK